MELMRTAFAGTHKKEKTLTNRNPCTLNSGLVCLLFRFVLSVQREVTDKAHRVLIPPAEPCALPTIGTAGPASSGVSGVEEEEG